MTLKTRVMMWKIQLRHHRNKLQLKYIQIELHNKPDVGYLRMGIYIYIYIYIYSFHCIFLSNKCSIVKHKRLLSEMLFGGPFSPNTDVLKC